MRAASIDDILDIAETEGRTAAREAYDRLVEAQSDAAREGSIDGQRALDEDATGQDCEDRATLIGCGADDSYDKSGHRRHSRFNDAGEARW